MGREFIDLFEGWAETYDDSVKGLDPEYQAVFAHYDTILDEVVNHSNGTVLEFGVGTGNLSDKLMKAGNQVIGIEPSQAMRELAKQKLPRLQLLDGDFIDFPPLAAHVETIVSSYAFHHLTDMEKRAAVEQFGKILTKNGKVVFADTMFETEAVKEQMIADAIEKGYNELAEDLNREYYPTIDVLKQIFVENNFTITCKQMNEFVWLIIAKK
ncbi:class I SAM-dependent DNA methyltransferase [Virgibacillus sp. FSP13]